MNIVCKYFGHKPPVYSRPGWYSPGNEYAKVIERTTDGIGRTHADVVGECARCGEAFTMARIHIPKIGE